MRRIAGARHDVVSPDDDLWILREADAIPQVPRPDAEVVDAMSGHATASDPRTEPARPVDLGRVLDDVRRRHWEDGEGMLVEAIRCHEAARTIGDAALQARALTMQAAISVQRGDLPGALALLTTAAPHAERDGGDGVRAELAAVRAHLSFFAGSYAESLAQAQQACELADGAGDRGLRIFVRRSSCLVFGNLRVRDWPERLADVLALTVAAGDRWEEAMSRNDLAHFHMEAEDLVGAHREMAHAMQIARELGAETRFLRSVLHCTRAEMRLRAGQAEGGLDDAERSIALQTATGQPNPYLLAMTVLVHVQALVALDRLDEAERAGRAAVARLGERVPQARGMILGTVATALREGGRTEEAYDVLAASTELERKAFTELSELQRGLERATLETRAARGQADALAAKNRELEQAVRELGETRVALERRTLELEEVERQLREQADRDWLTGLHNRRYLARELDRHAAAVTAGPLSLAVLDIDHFKSINDRFGHEVGDAVLRRVASVLRAQLRDGDAVVRSGGEEFVLLMPDTGEEAAAACCERLLGAIRAERWERVVPGLALTASIGVATAREASALDTLTARADGRLYEAKRAGRDRVVAS
jgi:diguanylate cyclase (GGDEF)-like protein